MQHRRLSLVRPESPRGASGNMLADEEYIAGVQRGDEAVFTALVRAYLPPLTRFAFGFVGVEDTAHDIVQDVFARVWQLGVDWKPTGEVAPYLFTAVRHRAFDVLKAGRASQRMQDTLRAEVDSTMEQTDPYVDITLLARVRREVRSLTERQQEALRLRYEQGQTMPQVAAVLGIDLSAAEKLIARALGALRARLADLREELD